jgi:diguanylate cyclase (GGDEF)-like protein/PAS domain S-box-containing protein
LAYVLHVLAKLTTIVKKAGRGNQLHWNLFHQRSIKTRVTLFTLVIFVSSIWALAFYSSNMLRSDMQELLSEQQYATASSLASVVNGELEERLKALTSIAATISPAMLQDPTAVQELLENRPILQTHFNGGVAVGGLDGTAIAEFPRHVGRVGINYRHLDFVDAALDQNKPAIGEPAIGPTLKVPVFGMGAPIRDANGKVIGALGGITRLDQANFLERVIQSFRGKSGGYLLIAPHQRLIITASDKNRALEVLPAKGSIPALDRFIEGYRGSDIFVNPVGVEVLASTQTVPATGWYVAAILPTADAFAPISDLHRRMFLGALALTVMAAALTWWMLRREISPLLDAANTLATLPGAGQPMQALPIARNDEVGRLIGGFNHLIEALSQRESELKDSEERFRSLMEQIPGVAVQGYAMDGTVTFWNTAAEQLYGYSATEALGGQLLELIIPPEMREGVADAMQQMARTREPIPAGEMLLQTKSGQRVPVFSSHALLKPPGQPLELFCLDIDLSETKRAQEQVRQLAFYDPLTGLPNRRLLGDRLSQTMAASKRSGIFAALMFLDLDNFKPLNDAHGHGVGDLLLIEVARRLCGCVREMDTVARFGGDEFVVMLGELHTDRAQSTEQARVVAEKIRASVAEPYQLIVATPGQADTTVEHHCTVSIGVVVFANHENTQANILQWADTAMYQAKDAGRNTIRFHPA